MGPVGASMSFQGAWLSTTTYSLLQSVTYGGSSYVALGMNLNQYPDTYPLIW